jgi:hypothetical protein
VYRKYEERWKNEIVMRYYKLACEFDETRVHGDYSVIGSEVCDFLASVLTFRFIKVFDKAGLLKEMNYLRIMSLLKWVKKVRVGEDSVWRLVKVNPKLEKMLALGSCLRRTFRRDGSLARMSRQGWAVRARERIVYSIGKVVFKTKLKGEIKR